MKPANLLMILALGIALASCGTTNSLQKRTANSHVPEVDESFFVCPVPRDATLPSDRTLSRWGMDDLWNWGEKTTLWGLSCADRLALAGYLRKCEKGDIQACTYVNQKLLKPD